MPIYDYTCSACGRLTEVIHGINDHGPRFCPECGAEGTMRKGFATPAIHFKGSGWAKKDRGAAAKPAKAKDDAGSPADSSPATSGESAAASGPKQTGGSSDSASKTASPTTD
jgi:putative FmdB family regulatory protein